MKTQAISSNWSYFYLYDVYLRPLHCVSSQLRCLLDQNPEGSSREKPVTSFSIVPPVGCFVRRQVRTPAHVHIPLQHHPVLVKYSLHNKDVVSYIATIETLNDLGTLSAVAQ